MMAASRGSTYSNETKRKIVRYVYSYPGRKGGDIAAALGLDRARVNSFLYGEGVKVFGLINHDWRHYPACLKPESRPRRSAGNATLSPGVRTIDQWDDGICANLSRMQLTAAQLKIRQMSLQAVEQAFSEDAFPWLSDDLKAELAIRKAELVLRQSQPMASIHDNSLAKQIVFWLGLALVVWLIAVANQRQSSSPPSLEAPSEQVR